MAAGFTSGLNGSTADTRYALSGNYFGQRGVIPGQGYTRGSGFASVSVAGPTSGFTEARLPALIDRVVAAAGEIARGLSKSWSAEAT